MVFSESQSERAWADLSQADRDAAFNNRAAIVGADDLIAARRAASRDVRSSVTCHPDLPYGPHPRECWDIFTGTSPDAPCLVFIHGGYWQGGDRTEFSSCVRGALERGWSAALCSYPLAPEASLAQIVQSVSHALAWLEENRAGYGAGGPLVLSGWSAGAHLAAMLADHDAVRAVLCVSGIFELSPLRDTFLNAKLNLTDQEIECLSPVRLKPVEKPFVIACGAVELPQLRQQSREFFDMREAAGVSAHLLVLPEANHLTVLDDLTSVHSTLLRAVEAELSSTYRSLTPGHGTLS